MANRIILLAGLIAGLDWLAIGASSAATNWPSFVGATLVIAFLVLVFPLNRHHHVSARGVALAALIAATATGWLSIESAPLLLPADRPLPLAIAVLGLLVYAMSCVVAAGMVLDWREARRPMKKLPLMPMELPRRPFVSIHVPIRDEPAELVRDTLDALAQIDWPAFEVIVVDQGSLGEDWQRTQAHCATLGFRFLRAEVPASRGAALNQALAACDPRTEAIAVVHAGTRVSPMLLHDLVPQFQADEVAVVHAGLNFRDGGKSLFKAICEADYRALLHVGMKRRDRNDALIHHNKLALVRRDTLHALGGWSEEAICEDAELDLRAFECGHAVVYLATPYGSGMLPERFTDYRWQRLRWIVGAIDTFRRWAAAAPLRRRLKLLGSLLPWLNDGLIVATAVATVAWSAAMLAMPARFEPPSIAFTALLMLPLLLKVATAVHHLRAHVEASVRQTCAATFAQLTLTHLGARALIAEARSRAWRQPTPKAPAPEHWQQALRGTVQESGLLLLLACALAGLGLAGPAHDWRWLAWLGLVVLLMLPYAAALLLAIIAGMPFLPARWVRNSGS